MVEIGEECAPLRRAQAPQKPGTLPFPERETVCGAPCLHDAWGVPTARAHSDPPGNLQVGCTEQVPKLHRPCAWGWSRRLQLQTPSEQRVRDEQRDAAGKLEAQPTGIGRAGVGRGVCQQHTELLWPWWRHARAQSHHLPMACQQQRYPVRHVGAQGQQPRIDKATRRLSSKEAQRGRAPLRRRLMNPHLNPYSSRSPAYQQQCARMWCQSSRRRSHAG